MKVPIKTRISGYKHDFVVKKNEIVKKIKESAEIKEMLSIAGNILFYGFLGGMTYMVFVSPSILIKFLGIGCGLVLFKNKILEWIMQILNSVCFVKIYK